MSVQIEDLLDSLRTHGTIDSTGEFRVDVQRAQSIVPAYQTSDPQLFLVAMIASLVSANASSIDISSKRFRSQVVLDVWGAELSLKELEACFSENSSSSQDSLLDMLLAIRAAFRTGVSIMEIICGEERLHLISNEARLRSSGFAFETNKIRIILHYPLVGSFFGNYMTSAQRKSVTHLRRLARWSRRPLSLHGESILSDYNQGGEDSYVIRVGSLDGSRFSVPVRNTVSDLKWSGALNFRKGQLQLVVDGITRGTLEHSYFHGVVYHPNFRLDVSREQVVQNDAIREIEADLETIFQTQLELVLEHLDISARVVPWYFYALWTACVLGDVGLDGPTRLSNWFAQELEAIGVPENAEPGPLSGAQVQAWSYSAPSSQLSAPTTAQKLIRQAATLDAVSNSNFKLEYARLLKICQQLLERDILENSELLETILVVLAERRPKQTLLRAYLLLGLGANFQKSGDTKRADKAWEKAIHTVASRRHRTEEQLIRAHLEFGLDHILEETRKLLEIQIQALEEGQWI